MKELRASNSKNADKIFSRSHPISARAQQPANQASFFQLTEYFMQRLWRGMNCSEVSEV